MSGYSNKRVSRLASNCPKDFEFEYFVYSNEAQYNIWCSCKRILLSLRQFENNTLWNMLISSLILICLILVSADCSNAYFMVLDTVFNVIFAVHVVLTTFERLRQAQYEDFDFTSSMKRAMTDTNLKGSVIGTALKYCFIFLVIRLFYSLLWMHIPVFQNKWKEVKSVTPYTKKAKSVNVSRVRLVSDFDVTDDSTTSKFIRSAYLINMMFLPVGPMVHPKNDYERIALLFVVITGSFVVTGAAVASLALVISLYMRPEEEFRGRFRLIIDLMKSTHVPQELRDKVETFYHMYWHKQKAISETELLPIFPHTIPCTIYTDIYFEAQQKSPILSDLSYQFLWELAKVMETTYYIPGDTIIKRDSLKSSIIYITYGDVEMLTAEDDQTAILRMTRGTIIGPCAGCPTLACAPAFVKIQAATFCIAHVLTATNLWRVACKYGKSNGQAFIILSSFEEHFEKVKRHYKGRLSFPVKYKSSILQFKRNLIALKEAKDEYGNHLLERTDFFLEISECYIMRNTADHQNWSSHVLSQRADSSLTEAADEICLRPTFPCILQPQSSLLVAWHSLVSVLIFIVSLTHPYYLMYFKSVSLEFRFFDYSVTAVFSLDLIVHLSTGVNVEEGVPITFTQTSSQQMRSYWFVLDVMGTIPFFEFIGDGKFAGLNKLLRLPKLFRMLKSMEDVCVYHSHLLRFMSYSLLMFILCYLVAGVQIGYMCYLHEHCSVKNITHSPFWIREPLTDKVTYRMFFGLYWAISIITFTAHNTSNWNTSDWRNLVYNSLLLESVAILYTFMESMYSATIMVTNSLKEDYDQTIANVKQFLIRSYVDPMLRHRFIRYLQLCWHTDKAYSMTQKKESIFYDLPPHVYQDIVGKQRIKYLLCVPFMKSGTQFLSAAYDRYVKLWDTESGACINRFTSRKVPYCAKFHPDEDKQHLFVAGTSEKKIICWDTRSGEIVQEYDRHLGAVNTITFVDENRRFVTTSDDKSLRVWEWDIPVDMKYIADPSMHSLPAVTSSPNGKWLACQSMDNKYVKKEDYKAISAASKLFYTSPNEILLNTGDINNEIFIIKQGICEVYDPETGQIVDTLHPKQSFGVLECLLRFPTYYTVRAVTHVQIFTISRKHLADVLSVPKIKDAIEHVKRHPYYLNVQMRNVPFLTYEDPPPTPNLARFPLLRKFEPDTAFLQPFMNLGFFSILRYIFPRFTIRPDGTYIYRYEWFRALCALTGSLMYPSYSYMVLQFPWLYTFLYGLDFCSYFDMIQRMMVGYYNHHGVLVYHPASTAANYIKGPFLVDLLASLPMENLESTRSDETASSETSIESVSFVKQLLMLNRLLQLYRVPGAMDILSQFIPREDVILVIKSIPLFMILLNVLTCFVVFSSVKIFIPPLNSSLVTWKYWKIVPFDDKGGSWINLFSNTYRFNMTESPWNLQLTIYSWVVNEITTTGFNNFKPSNLNLIRVLVFGMCAGCMMKTYFSVRIISIRANVNKMLANFQESMKDIMMYMKREKLSPHVQAKVLDYYEYNWDKTGGLDYRNVLKLCHQITLRTDAILHLYGHTFNKCSLLYHCDTSLLRVVGRSVRGVNFLAGTRIIHKNDVITDMYIVDYGTLDVKENKGSHLTLANLCRGSVFGNMEKQESVRCTTDFITTSNVQLLQINAMLFHTIIVDFPMVKVLMKKYRPKNENYILGRLTESSGSLADWKQPKPHSSTNLAASLTGVTKHLNINSRPAQYFLILVSLLCVYADIYNAGFQFNHLALIACLYILDMCFYMKIIFHYILPFVVSEGEARDELIDARKEYIKGEFKYDILSCLPIEFFCFLFERTEDKWRWLSVLRLNRLLRIATISGCLTRHFAKLSINLTISTVIMTLIWFSLFVHGMACIWYAIGVSEDNVKKNSSWLHKDDGSDVCDNAYICSIYFILTTFIEKGVGDVLPKKQLEVVFTIILELMSTMMYMIYVGEFSNIFQYQSFRSFAYYRKHLELQDFLSNNRVSKNLVSLVKKYSLHLWRESRGVQMPHFLVNAPPCFKLKIMGAAYMKHFVNHPAFTDCEPAFLRQLVGCVQLYTYSPEIYVAKEGEITDSMYLVHKGGVHEIDEDMDQKLDEFNAGQSFGMVHGLIRNLPFNFSYKTVKKSEVLTLNLDSWEHLLRLFPKSRFEIFKNVPNHPYGKPPDNKGPQRLNSIGKTPPVISQPIYRKSPLPLKSKPIEAPSEEQLKPLRGIAPAAATIDTAGATGGTAASLIAAAGLATAAGLDTTAGLGTAAGVVATKSLTAENDEKEVVATNGETKVTSATTGTSLVNRKQKTDTTLPEQTIPMTNLTVSHPSQDDEVTSTNVDIKSERSDAKSQKNVDKSKLKKTPSNIPLKLEEQPPVEFSSSLWPLDSRHRSDDETKKPKVEGKEIISVSPSTAPAESKTSWGSLKTITAPRQPVQFPSHPNLEASEIESTSSKDVFKSIQTIESKYFDDNDLDKATSQNNLFRRMTITARKLIGKDKKEKDSLQIEQDLKITSDLLDKYKKKVGTQNKKTLLDLYIEKREAEMAKTAAETQNNEVQVDEEFEFKASRRSVVAFDNEQKKSERELPLQNSDNDEEDEIGAIPIAPRRSVVVFGDRMFSEGKKIKIENEDEHGQTLEREISQTTATRTIATRMDKEKKSNETAISNLRTPTDRPKLPMYLSNDDKPVENEFSGFPYPVLHKDSDDKMSPKQNESKILKNIGKEEDKLETRSGKSVLGILEPQSEVMMNKSIDLWKLKNESENKNAEVVETEQPINDESKFETTGEINNEQLKPVFLNENKSDISNVKKMNEETTFYSEKSNGQVPVESKDEINEEKSFYSPRTHNKELKEEDQQLSNSPAFSPFVENEYTEENDYRPSASTSRKISVYVPSAEVGFQNEIEENDDQGTPASKPKPKEIPDFEMPQTSKSAIKKDKKSVELSEALGEFLTNNDDASPSFLEEYLNQTHKSKEKTTSHDNVVMKRKTDGEKRMEKRMTKVRYEGDGSDEFNRSTGTGPESPADDDLRAIDLQLPMTDLQQLMDSDEASTRPAVNEDVKSPPPPE